MTMPTTGPLQPLETLGRLRMPPDSGWRRAVSLAVSLGGRLVRMGRRAPRRLRLCENLPLGERRFVAVIEFEQSRFLVGGTSSSLTLLAQLEGESGRKASRPNQEPQHEIPEPRMGGQS